MQRRVGPALTRGSLAPFFMNWKWAIKATVVGWGIRIRTWKWSFCKMPFEMSEEFRVIPEHLETRDFPARAVNTLTCRYWGCSAGQDTNRSLPEVSDI